MKLVITGNHAASFAAKLARAQVISAYPITPQTEIVEKLSNMVADGELNAEFIKVESEHSAMAACIGASTVGARAFTATSSQGLALMHEMLHWAAGARLPIVMVNVNRAMAPPWNIWADQTDSVSQRDTGWMQFYCETNQEVLDTVIQAYKICERVSLPAMISMDSFILSHTSEIVDIPAQEEVDEFLPPYKLEHALDHKNPRAFGGLTTAEWYYELRYKIEEAMQRAKDVAEEVCAEFDRMFGRRYGLVEEYKTEDANTLIVTSASIVSTARDAVDILRKAGEKVGLVKIRALRPFPKDEIRKAVGGAESLCVIDRNISFGNEGVFCSETKAALVNSGKKISVCGFIAGLGGRQVSVDDVVKIARDTAAGRAGEINWTGLKE